MISKSLIFAAFITIGCSAPPAKAPEPPPRWPGLEPVLVSPSVEADAVARVLTTLAAPNPESVTAFCENATGPDTMAPAAKAALLDRTSGRRQQIEVRGHDAACFARVTSAGVRAATMRRSSRGWVVPPLEWMAAAIEIPGPKEADVEAWYLAMSQRVATTGKATGLVQYFNGNGSAIVLELRRTNDSDMDLIATSHFMRAGEFDPAAWGPSITGASGVSTKQMNGHRGITVLDLIGKRPIEPVPTTKTL